MYGNSIHYYHLLWYLRRTRIRTLKSMQGNVSGASKRLSWQKYYLFSALKTSQIMQWSLKVIPYDHWENLLRTPWVQRNVIQIVYPTCKKVKGRCVPWETPSIHTYTTPSKDLCKKRNGAISSGEFVPDKIINLIRKRTSVSQNFLY